VQFQFLQLALSKTLAESVMSTPLFLLNPDDSLLMAHQEMNRRHVRRLVVSWNWGRELGIVTQTSLLRVFDPMEMYGVIKTLQRTVQQLESEKVERLRSHNMELGSALRKRSEGGS
jgi:signal-transduction protein with cAMP-binding, CBS, and nucleotidyltransferase domain